MTVSCYLSAGVRREVLLVLTVVQFVGCCVGS